ncbi:MAG: helicase, partial [Daejeonella sp.]|nr:helicase [Daejeonella sp.]
QFNLLNKNKTIRIVSLIAGPSVESQMDELTDGVDIVVATPDRARSIYLKLGLNLNKIQMFVVDDADLIVKQGMQLPVNELANSIIKCQRLVFTSVMHSKLETMISPFIRQPFVIEVDEEVEASSETYPQILYPVINFRTKINLLNLLLQDSEEYPKVAVFVNTRLTAEKLYKSLSPTLRNEAAVYNPIFFDTKGIHDIVDFLEAEDVRILILANELLGPLSVEHIPVIIHFELPDEKETFIPRIVKHTDSEEEVTAISFATDIELTMVKKIEQAIGSKFLTMDLPDGLIIDKELKGSKVKKTTQENSFNSHGGAFHEKKDSNNKDYNYSSKAKARMNKKKNHL